MQRLLNSFRSLLPKVIKRKIKSILGLPLLRMHPDWRILEPIGGTVDKHIVFDIGARNGWFFQCWKKWCPAAEIHAFEPDIGAYNRLSEWYKKDESIHLSQLGVGDKESVETFYHMAESEVSSSFLQHDEQVWGEIQYETGNIDSRQLEITTLDKYVKQENIDDVYLIKIDIQGYELKALRGATETLKNTSYILVESAIQSLYKEAATFGQVHDYLVDHGFHLMNFRAWHRGNNKLMETDMLFRRDDLAPSIGDGDNGERFYIGE